MTDDHEIRNRLHDLGASVPGRGGGVDAVRARATRRHRRRIGAAALAVVALAGTGVAAIATTGDEGGEQRRITAARPDGDPSDPTEPAVNVPEPDRYDGAIVVDVAPTAHVIGSDGTELRTFSPYPDRTNTRARGVGRLVVVVAPDGAEAAILDLTTGDERTIPLDPVVDSDVWTAGVVDGVPTLVHTAYDPAGNGVVHGYDLTTGDSELLASAAGSSIDQPSITDDGTIYASVLNPDAECSFARLDPSTGTLEDTSLVGCDLVEPVVSPDGESVFDATEEGLIRYDLATGNEVDRWDVGQVQAEGLQVDVGTSAVLLGNSYDDAEHGPFTAVDLATDDQMPLPVRGSPSHLD